jgi:hypothetical protein
LVALFFLPNPIAIDGHALSIRKHRESKLSLSDYVAMGAFAAANARPEMAEAIVLRRGSKKNEALWRALVAFVQLRKNVLVGGGTSQRSRVLATNSVRVRCPCWSRDPTNNRGRNSQGVSLAIGGLSSRPDCRQPLRGYESSNFRSGQHRPFAHELTLMDAGQDWTQRVDVTVPVGVETTIAKDAIGAKYAVW